ncbi:histamine H1 receptor-like [Polyodon spathula]|uniref:histamine H1 receptor-like n=1 Tax=Polyodon spathula TaxID=7913 RepID=UPI001B7DF21B|nr:histamine H1 receptor-like [Polyodon spathula]
MNTGLTTPHSWLGANNHSSNQSNETCAHAGVGGRDRSQVLMGLLLSCLCIVTVLMNTLVLYAVKSERALHTVANMYITSLASADFLIGSVVMPLSLAYLLDEEWKMGRAACKFWLSLDYIASTASIFSLFVLCLDRYRSVRRPLAYIRLRTKARAGWLIALAWLLSASWLVPILGWPQSAGGAETDTVVTQKQCDTEFRHSSWFKLLAAFLNFYLPSAFMLWYYSRIYKAVQKHCRQRSGSFGVSSGIFPESNGLLFPGEWESKKGAFERGKDLVCTKVCGGKRRSNLRSFKYKCGRPISEQNSDGPSVFSEYRHHYPVSFSGVRLPSGYTRLMGMELKPIKKGHSQALKTHADQDSGERFMEEGIANRIHPQTSARKCGGKGTDIPEWKEMQDILKIRNLCEIPVKGSGRNPGNGNAKSVRREPWMRGSFPRRPSWKNKDRKAARQLGVIVAVFMVCWTPYFVSFTITALCDSCISAHTHMVTIWLGYLNSTLNPFIYPLSNTTFRKTFRQTLRQQHCLARTHCF